MSVSANSIVNSEFKNIDPPLKHTTFSILQKTATFVALAALAGIAGSIATGSFVATAVCVTLMTAAIAITIILSKPATNLSKGEVISPAHLNKSMNSSVITPNSETALITTFEEKPMPLHLLPLEALPNLFTFLPITALGCLGQVNKKFSDLFASESPGGRYIWKLIANTLKIPLITNSEMSPKAQVKSNLIIEYPEATLDLVKNKLFLKRHECHNDSITGLRFINTFIAKQIPNEYYLRHDLFYNMVYQCSFLWYRENDETKMTVTTIKGMAYDDITDEESSFDSYENDTNSDIIDEESSFDSYENDANSDITDEESSFDSYENDANSDITDEQIKRYQDSRQSIQDLRQSIQDSRQSIQDSRQSIKRYQDMNRPLKRAQDLRQHILNTNKCFEVIPFKETV